MSTEELREELTLARKRIAELEMENADLRQALCRAPPPDQAVCLQSLWFLVTNVGLSGFMSFLSFLWLVSFLAESHECDRIGGRSNGSSRHCGCGWS